MEREEILAAIKGVNFDAASDDHWTGTGLPSVSFVQSALSSIDPKLITRKAISEALGDAFIRPAEFVPEDGKEEEEPAEAKPVTVDDVVAFCGGDPVLLLEAVVALANTDRFRRNNALYGIAMHYGVEQKQIREWQSRLDARAERKLAEQA